MAILHRPTRVHTLMVNGVARKKRQDKSAWPPCLSWHPG